MTRLEIAGHASARPTPPTSRKQLAQIPGITPAKMYPGVTRNAYHLYMFRYDPSGFAGLSRAALPQGPARRGRAGQQRLLAAQQGAVPRQRRSPPPATSASTARRTLKSAEERSRTPQNDRLCEEAVWLTQTMLIGPREDMDHIVEAVRKIQKHAGDIARQSN